MQANRITYACIRCKAEVRREVSAAGDGPARTCPVCLTDTLIPVARKRIIDPGVLFRRRNEDYPYQAPRS